MQRFYEHYAPQQLDDPTFVPQLLKAYVRHDAAHAFMHSELIRERARRPSVPVSHGNVRGLEAVVIGSRHVCVVERTIVRWHGCRT